MTQTQTQSQMVQRHPHPWRAGTPHRASSHRSRLEPRGGSVRTGAGRGGMRGDSRVMPCHVWDSDHEPDLASMLTDPIVGLVMDRDGLSPEDVAAVMGSTRARLLAGRSV